MSDDLHKLATELVDAIRDQNWKNGGIHSVDRPEAIGKVCSALRAAYTDGMTAGIRHSTQITSHVFEAIIGGRH